MSGNIENSGGKLYYTDNTATRSQLSTIQDVAEQTYTGTPNVAATTAPSGAVTANYRWTKLGGMVTLRIYYAYATAGSATTAIELPLPADLPAPIVPTGITTSALVKLYTGSGDFSNTTTTQQNNSKSYIVRNSSDNGYSELVVAPSNACKYAYATITYWTN